MKKLLLVFLFSSISLLTFSQSKEKRTYESVISPYDVKPFEIWYDNYSERFDESRSKSLWAKDRNLSKGFEIRIFMKKDIDSNGWVVPIFDAIQLTPVGIGRNCIDQGSTLVLELEDGSQLSYSYIGNFNCIDEDFFYYIPKVHLEISYKDWDKLFNLKLKKMSFTEKRTGESFTYKLKKEEQEFFMEVKEATTRLQSFGEKDKQ